MESFRRAHRVSKIRQDNRVNDQQQPKRRSHSARCFSYYGVAIEKRHCEQKSIDQSESKYPQKLSLDAENMARKQFQRLKHRHEIPFGFDADGRRLERI